MLTGHLKHHHDARLIQRVSLLIGRLCFLSAAAVIVITLGLDRIGVTLPPAVFGLLTLLTLVVSVICYSVAWFLSLGDQMGDPAFCAIPILGSCLWLITLGSRTFPIASVLMAMTCAGLALTSAVLLIALRTFLHHELKPRT